MVEEFEIALRKLHNAGCKRFGDDWLRRIERRRENLKKAYAALDEPDRDPIPYASLSARTAYVFAYAPTRAEYTRQFLKRHRVSHGAPLFGEGCISVVSFGGGPASELVGLIRYLEDADSGENVEAIDYVVYDKDGDWEDVAFDVANAIETGIEIEMRYEEVDVASRHQMVGIDLSDVDLVMFSYVMSELSKLEKRDKISENFRTILGSPSGSNPSDFSRILASAFDSLDSL